MTPLSVQFWTNRAMIPSRAAIPPCLLEVPDSGLCDRNRETDAWNDTLQRGIRERAGSGQRDAKTVVTITISELFQIGPQLIGYDRGNRGASDI